MAEGGEAATQVAQNVPSALLQARMALERGDVATTLAVTSRKEFARSPYALVRVSSAASAGGSGRGAERGLRGEMRAVCAARGET